MRIKCIILLYLSVFITVTATYPTVSSSYPQANESITQYILDLSRDINNSIQVQEGSILSDSRGEIRLKLLLSPWGELEDAYVSKSSDNEELDNLCLNAVWMYGRYQPFPEELGEDSLWIDVPIIFDVSSTMDDRAATGERARLSLAQPEERARRGLAHLGGLAHISSIEEAVDIASENNMAARIAQEEIELSSLKIREARRALYPAASLNYLETSGSITTNIQDFTDKEYKVKFEFPLYYGWRLKYAVDQAVSNMKASRHNYDKVVQDLRIEVEVAFYSYLTSRINEKEQRALLLKEVQEIFDGAKKRFDLGLSTRAEFMQVDSQLKQVTYQLASSENDTDLARLTLAQAMDIEDPEDLEDLIDTDIDFMDLGYGDIGVTLEQCTDIAFKNRPDLKAKEYAVEFNDYERKIQESKDQLKVDLTGSYGQSGGAFESETLELADDWFVGIKVSKPLGGNTLSTSYTEEKTSEKHGQTSTTETASKSVELGLLDNLQGFSEKKSSEIALKKAQDELKQTKGAIFKEVSESYLNYKKGLLQVKANLNKIKYREEELKIAKARAGLNEIPSSELIQAHINLTDEKSFYIEALGSLYQSLARLNKATGYALFLDDGSFRLAQMRP